MTQIIDMRWVSVVAALAVPGCGLFEKPQPQLENSLQRISFEVVNGDRAATDRKAEMACGNYGQRAQFSEIKPSGNRQIAYYDCK